MEETIIIEVLATNFFCLTNCWFLQAFDGHSLLHTMLILNS